MYTLCYNKNNTCIPYKFNKNYCYQIINIYFNFDVVEINNNIFGTSLNLNYT